MCVESYESSSISNNGHSEIKRKAENSEYSDFKGRSKKKKNSNSLIF